jgi:hypothetical protein
MTQAISSGRPASLAGELAELLLAHESVQADSAKQERDAAREAFLTNSQRQVDSLHQAASATMSGAFIGASLTVAGGAFSIGAASFQYQADVGKAANDCSSEIANNQLSASILGDLGQISSKLADPTKAFLGDSTAAHFQAEAKRQETLAEQAKWQAGDASTAVDKADKRGDKILESLQGTQQNENSSATAIIGRI